MLILFETDPGFQMGTVYGEPYVGVLLREASPEKHFVERYEPMTPIYDGDEVYMAWYIHISEPTVFEVHLTPGEYVYLYCDTERFHPISWDNAQQMCGIKGVSHSESTKLWITTRADAPLIFTLEHATSHQKQEIELPPNKVLVIHGNLEMYRELNRLVDQQHLVLLDDLAIARVNPRDIITPKEQ